MRNLNSHRRVCLGLALTLLSVTACGSDDETPATTSDGEAGPGGAGGTGGAGGMGSSCLGVPTDVVGSVQGVPVDAATCQIGSSGANVNATRYDATAYDDGMAMFIGHFLHGAPSSPNVSLIHMPATSPIAADEWLCGGPSTSVTLGAGTANTYHLAGLSSLGTCVDDGSTFAFDDDAFEDFSATLGGEEVTGSAAFASGQECVGRVCAFTIDASILNGPAGSTGFMMLVTAEPWSADVPTQIERAVFGFTGTSYVDAELYCAGGGSLTLSSSTNRLAGSLTHVGQLGGCPGSSVEGEITVTTDQAG